MWTTSSSRAERRRRGLVLLLAAGGAITGCAAAVAPDAPAPARAQPERPPAIAVDWARPVELVGAEAREVDDELARLAPSGFLEGGERPLAIVVTVRDALDPTPRDAFPVIEVNGRVLAQTRVRGERALIGFLRNDRELRARNEVFVYWVGAERRTRSPKPVYFTWPAPPGR